MEFNSLAFLIFLPLVLAMYYLLPAKRRWILLLLASYFFYGFWKVEFLALIVFSTVLDFIVAQKIHKSTNQLWRRVLLCLSLCGNLGMLVIFKYLILFLPEIDPMNLYVHASENPLMGTIKHAIYFSIPVGISFYTFQTMSYTIDVYFKRVNPETHLGRFAVFVSFFPQLVAGPIERFSHLQPQLKAAAKFTYDNMANAFRLMLYGFFLKMCIADNLAPLVNSVYDAPELFTKSSTLFGTLAFGFQIYADFAGYSLIAQGAALALGIKLIDNFKTPYWSKNISEFWHRWHISLSTWFRDYLYIPLGGNRVAITRWAINIMLVFTISGFWHGASWSFMVWGAIHGLIFLMERFGDKLISLKDSRSNIIKGLRILKTFVLVQFAWIFFRGKSMDKAQEILRNITSSRGVEKLSVEPIVLFLFVLFIIMDIVLYNKRFDRWVAKLSMPLRWGIYAILIFCITAFAGHINHPFIYFQF